MESAATCLNRSISNFIACETTFKVKDPTSIVQFWGRDFEFSSGTCNQNKWRLYIGLESDYLEANLSGYQSDELQVWFCLSIIDSDGFKRYVIRNQVIFFTKQSHTIHRCGKIVTIQQLRDDQKLLHDGELWLHCEIATEKQFNIPSFDVIADNLTFRQPVNVEEEDIDTFLPMLGKFSDLILAVGDKEIKAHKFMLAMRSPVFSAMFESEMMEQKQNRVVIADMDYEVVAQMLLYMYTGKVPKLSEMADRLLMAAEKYTLDILKILCQQQLSRTISVDNVLQLMSLADLYNADLLKDKLNEFVKKNIDTLMDKPSWLMMLYEMSHKQ